MCISGRCHCPTPSSQGDSRNPCANNTGTNNVCGSEDSYVTCSDTVCTKSKCPAQQLWNKAAKACVACKPGLHVAADYPQCVCEKGKILNDTSGICKTCPASSTLFEDGCFCNSTGDTPFFSANEWACKGCPGQYVLKNMTAGDSYEDEVIQVTVCHCPGDNDIFDVRTVSCSTCPTGTKAVKDQGPMGPDYCQ